MRAAIYIRVSTEEQATEGFSLGAQEERCKSFLESQGWQLSKVYMDDGYSAKDLNRPAMKKMLQDMKTKEFDVVVIYRLDRMTRSVIDLHNLLKEFDEKGVSFKSVTEVFDTTTAMGRFLITLVGAMAQWERENLGERVRMGQERRALEGKWHGGIVPYGYRLEDRKLVISENEAEIVRQIFNLYEEVGVLKIIQTLNNAGKRKDNILWSTRAIQYILTNPFYAGKVRISSNEQETLVDGEHEAIISLDQFERTQQILSKRNQTPGSKRLTSDYPFSSVLYCPRCGSPMSGRRKKKKSNPNEYYFSYQCTNKNHYNSCRMPNLGEKAIEEALLSKIETILDVLDVDPDSLLIEEKQETKRSKEDILADLRKVEERKAKYQKGWADGLISDDDLRKRTSEDNELQLQLFQELEAVEEEEKDIKIKPDREELIQLVHQFKTLWHHGYRRDRKELIQTLFKKIVVDLTEQKRHRSAHYKAVVIDYELNL